MKEVKAYESGGELFRDKDDALVNDARIDVRSALTRYHPQCNPGVIDAFVRTLVEHGREFAYHLNKVGPAYPPVVEDARADHHS